VNTVPTPPRPGETHPRFELIVELLTLVGFLSDHPELPMGRETLTIVLNQPSGASDSDQIAFVRQVARVLDVDPDWLGDTHFYATRRFGKHVRIEARAILQVAMDEHERMWALGREALAAEKAAAAELAREVEAAKLELEHRRAAAAETVEMVVVVDPPAAAPVDEGQADDDTVEYPWVTRSPEDELGDLDDEPAEPELRVCPVCEGGQFADVCNACFGSGRVLANPPKCAGCGGTGRAVDEFCIATNQPCEFCQGKGYQQRAAAGTW